MTLHKIPVNHTEELSEIEFLRLVLSLLESELNYFASYYSDDRTSCNQREDEDQLYLEIQNIQNRIQTLINDEPMIPQHASKLYI
ncbi:hypothetical protein SAMN05428961_11066 [Paenibacillus sp. OK060]|nr:hypothetical protein SAMN05428961_11066 [Paenibacillus sp. OK060]